MTDLTEFAFDGSDEHDDHAGQGDPDDERADYSGRVTVDLDGYRHDFEMAAVRAYHELDRRAERVDVAISSGGEGLHLVGWFEDALTFDDRERLRRHLGDDPNRVKIDRERRRHGVYTGVLWSEKHTKTRPEDAPEDRPGKQRGFRDVYDALDVIRARTTDDADRVQALAEHGHKGAPELATHAGRWDS